MAEPKLTKKERKGLHQRHRHLFADFDRLIKEYQLLMQPVKVQVSVQSKNS